MFELTFNGVSGRAQLQRLNGALVCAKWGFRPISAHCPARPGRSATTPGIPLPPNIELLADDLEMPESWQISAGISQRLGVAPGWSSISRRIWIDGTNETIFRNTNWAGNACRDDGDPSDCWLDPSYRWILKRTERGPLRVPGRRREPQRDPQGRSPHRGIRHRVASKKNLGDRWGGFDTPSDSADIEAEWGPSGTDERIQVRRQRGLQPAVAADPGAGDRVRLGPAVEPRARFRRQR